MSGVVVVLRRSRDGHYVLLPAGDGHQEKPATVPVEKLTRVGLVSRGGVVDQDPACFGDLMARPTLFLVVGLPGTGKTTDARRIEAEQRASLARIRAERDSAAVEAALVEMKAAAVGTDNILVPMKKALAARATIGEVSNALRDVWGTYTPHDNFLSLIHI